MKHRNLIIIAAIILAAGIGTAIWYEHNSHVEQNSVSENQTIYYCPMHPNYTSDRPGECPICGMTLVKMEKEIPKHENEEIKQSDNTSVTISADRQQLIRVKKATIKMETATKTIRTVGKVAFDPELAIAQREYIEAMKVGDKTLADAARQRLMLMEFGEDQIKELKGKVQQNLYLPGKTAWVYPIIYEYELPNIVIGQPVAITPSSGGKTKTGTIRAIDPVIDQTTRTVRLRIEVPNEDGELKPNMFVNANLEINLGPKLLVPKDAVIDSGERKIVFMIHNETMFMPMEVKLGTELTDNFLIESGLSEGDEVATSANFLIDAESKLKASLGNMAGHKHGE